jgi:hypothetical protein
MGGEMKSTIFISSGQLHQSMKKLFPSIEKCFTSTGARIRIQDVLTTRQYLSLPCTFHHTLSTKKKHHQRTKNKQMESPNEGEGGTLTHTKTKIQPVPYTGVGGGAPHHQLRPMYSTTSTEMKPSISSSCFE